MSKKEWKGNRLKYNALMIEHKIYSSFIVPVNPKIMLGPYFKSSVVQSSTKSKKQPLQIKRIDEKETYD